MEYKILVIEDDKGIREAIAIYLRNQGYEVVLAENGQVGLDILEKETIHLAIVDIMMPVMDGMTFTLNARQKYDFPIIFLSAKSEDIDKISGLNIGADDYMTKPFQFLELLARVKSQLRRYDQILKLKNELNPSEQDDVLSVDGLELNQNTKEVRVEGELVRLTPKEFQILALLMSHPGRVYSAEQIYESIWQEQAINTETIMVHIRKLREKIEIDPKNPRYIKVVWGLGYKIEKR